jgi:hypothetical protein
MGKFQNKSSFQLKLAVYRADGLKLSNDTPKLGTKDCFELQGSDTSGFDWAILLVFLKDSLVPPAINVSQTTEGFGITLGANVVAAGTGGGFSIGVSTVSSVQFSTPLGMHVVSDDDNFEFTVNQGQIVFTKVDDVSDCADTKKLDSIIDYSTQTAV